MHTVIVRTRKNRLTERNVLDDDEFDIRLYCNWLEACVNAGTKEECNFALDRIQSLGLKTCIETYGSSDYLAVFP